jgi:hypothetical protein
MNYLKSWKLGSQKYGIEYQCAGMNVVNCRIIEKGDKMLN